MIHPFALTLALLLPIANDETPADKTEATQATFPALKTLDLSGHFNEYDGCFALFDTRGNTLYRFNPTRCAERFSPCSTFKIPNSLFGLETGVISDAEHQYKWDGVKRWRDALNQDHTLRTAVRDSVPWYFQKLANEVGEKKMKHWLDAFNYGNQDMSAGLTQFWLGSSLKISADEQIAFLCRLQNETLPVSKRTHRILKEVITLESTATHTFRGKTGTDASADFKRVILGWFVGTVETNDNAYIFACNISADDKASGPNAKRICIDILRERGILPKQVADKGKLESEKTEVISNNKSEKVTISENPNE